jgi:hypothetical protein
MNSETFLLRQKKHQPTDLTVRITSLETKTHSHTKEIPSLWWDQKIHLRDHCRQINPFHIITHFSFKIILILFSHLRLDLQGCVFPNKMCNYLIPHVLENLPILFSLTRPSQQNLVKTTNYKVPHYAVLYLIVLFTST